MSKRTSIVTHLGKVMVGRLPLSLAAAAVVIAVFAAAAIPVGPQPAFAAGPTPRATPTRLSTLAATRTPAATNGVRPTATRPAASATLAPTGPSGVEVYKKYGCGGCHTLAAAGTTGTFGPSHEHLATNAAKRIHAADYDGDATTAEGYLRESIASPATYQAPEYRKFKYAMPAFKNIEPAELDELVRFLLTVK